MDILRKRTFLEETASAKVEANSGETAMPDVADMMERDAALLELSLIVTLMSTPPNVPYQAYRVCTWVFLFSCPFD